MAPSSPPQISDSMATTLVTTQNVHHGHLSSQIPNDKQSLLTAIQQLKKLPESAHITPHGLLVFLNNALQLHASHANSPTPIIYTQANFTIPTAPSALELNAALIVFKLSIEELQGFQSDPITGNSPPQPSPPRDNLPSPPHPPSRSPSPDRQLPAAQKAVIPPDPATIGLKSYTRMPKKPTVTYSAMKAEAEQFAKDYPDITTRGGYNVTARDIDKKDFNGDYFAPQPAWRQKLFRENPLLRQEYYIAPQGYRVDPRYHPIPRRQVWTITYLSLDRGAINWPLIPDFQKQGWDTELDIQRAVEAFYRDCYYSPDPHVREASAHCELLSFLMKRQIQFEQNLGPLLFNPNKPVSPQVVQRLYFRVCHTPAINVAQFERWQATQWLIGMNRHFGPIHRWSTTRHDAHRQWHWETQLHNRQHKGKHWM